ncbi:MAG: B12-binding domain-containing radical SAM protein, partial [Acholeplasmatales bacterium]|nr:B12-binding domain-containing radical SAM protein [Acholeplasmatales bacterium]
MKALLIGINAKYIHPNLAIRLLKKNTNYDCDIKEYTIKDDYKTIIDFINNSNYEVIAFSCYIWNINMI